MVCTKRTTADDWGNLRQLLIILAIDEFSTNQVVTRCFYFSCDLS